MAVHPLPLDGSKEIPGLYFPAVDVAAVLAQKYNVLKTEGNFNNEIGLPLTIFRIREEHEAAVLEMGISDFGEMTRLSRMAKPNLCVITTISLYGSGCFVR